ncbi:MAG: hypothetical protein Q7T21_14355 [Gallionella sp.]|nr:hypothetical protein [Gallionella sp.]
MKKKLALLCVLGCFTQPVLAASIDTLQLLTQSEFKLFSEDLGAALSYKSATPAEPLGITGFELGVGATSTEMKNPQLWTKATGSELKTMILPKLYVYKGLPFNIDVAAFYSAVPSTNIKLTGFELRYAILEGGVASPAVAVRGAITKLSGVNQLSLGTKNLDVSISKGFAIFTPYAGVGSVWVDSTPNAAGSLTKETFRQSKIFAGANINMGFSNFVIEYDKTGSSTSYGAKLGFRF